MQQGGTDKYLKMMKKETETILIVFGLIVIIVVFIFVFLSDFRPQISAHYKKTCMNLNNATLHPKLIQVKYDSPDTKAGVYCVLKNGSLKDITIREAIN